MIKLAYRVRKDDKFMIVKRGRISWGERSESWVSTSSQSWLEKTLYKWGVTGYTLEKVTKEEMYL